MISSFHRKRNFVRRAREVVLVLSIPTVFDIKRKKKKKAKCNDHIVLFFPLSMIPFFLVFFSISSHFLPFQRQIPWRQYFIITFIWKKGGSVCLTMGSTNKQVVWTWQFSLSSSPPQIFKLPFVWCPCLLQALTLFCDMPTHPTVGNSTYLLPS